MFKRLLVYLLVLGTAVGHADLVFAQQSSSISVIDANPKTVSAASDEVAIELKGNTSISVHLIGSGTWTTTFQVTNDSTDAVKNGTATWVDKKLTPSTGTQTPVATATAAGGWDGSVGSWKWFRARISAYTSGNPIIKVRAAPFGGGSGGGGGGSSTASLTLQESDDASIAGGQTADAIISLPYVYSGSAWVRAAVGGGATGTTVPRIDIANDGDVAIDINDISGFASTAATKLTLIESRLISAATLAQAALTQGDQVMFYANSTAPTAVTDGQSQRPWVDLNGRIQTNLSMMAGVATPLLTATLDDALVNTQDGLAVINLPYLFNGSTWSRAPGSATTGAYVGGVVNDDQAIVGNPIGIGGLATTSIVGQTPATTARRISFVGGADRVQITRPYSNLEDRVSGHVANTDGAATSLVAAQGAGVRFCATTFIVANSSATNVTVLITDGSGGTTLTTLPAAANMGGAVVPLAVPLCTTANTAMFMDGSAAATTVSVTAVGFKTEL